MQFSRDHIAATYRIDSVSDNDIIISGKSYQSSVVVMAEQLITDWPPRDINSITQRQMTDLLQYDVEIIVLGTGVQQQFLSPEIMQAIYAQKVGLEVMSTPAACRTYSILSAEGRRVLAALIMEN